MTLALYLQLSRPVRRCLVAIVLILFATSGARADVIRMLDDDRDAAQARVDLIRGAKDRIDVAYFLARDDQITLAMLQLLRDAARRGVHVRVIIDGTFRRIPKDVLSHLRDEGVLIRSYHPFDLRHLPWMLKRMHEKVIAVDGKRYITGGRNLAQSYFGLGRKTNYRDIDIYVEGASAVDAEARFEQIWTSRDVATLRGHVTSGSKRKAAEHLGDALAEMTHRGFIDLGPARDWSKDATDVGAVQFLAGHEIGGDMAKYIAAAKESIVIESPYFIPPRFFRELLLAKLAEGVHVVVVTNSARSTDGLFPYVGYLKYRRTFVRAGVDFREYKGPSCLHGKAIIVDGRVVMIGSYNIDPRSQYLNTEIMCVFESRSFAHELQELIEHHIEHSWAASDAPPAAPLKVFGIGVLMPVIEHQL